MWQKLVRNVVIDEMKLIRDRDRAQKAQALLDNDMLKEAFETLEREYTKALFLTRPEAAQSREALYLAVNVVRKVRDQLNSVLNDGALATSELKAIAETAERKKRFGII